MPKQIYLFITSITVIVLFFAIPVNYDWLANTILFTPTSYATQFSYMSAGERKLLRYSGAYSIYMQWVHKFHEDNLPDPVILIPPVGYLREQGVLDVAAIEPAEFYYYTGFKALYATDPNVGNATWVVVPNKPEVMLRRIHNQEDLNNLIMTYIQYKDRN